MGIEESLSSFELWRDRPDIFVQEVFGVTPDAWQIAVLRAFPHKPRIAMKACKGPGKTATLCWLAWNFLLTRHNPRIAAVSITGQNLADNLWAEMAKWQQRSRLLRENFEWTKTRIEIKDKRYSSTWWMSARSWSKSATTSEQGDTLAGLHEDNVMLIMDESGGIPEAVSMAAEAILSSCVEGHIVQAGNPSDLNGTLYRACTRDKSLWHVVEITSDPDDPQRTPRVSKEWAQQQIDLYGRDNPYIKVNILGQFPSAAFNALIGVDEVTAAMGRIYKPYEFALAPRVLGVDVAREGADTSVIYPRQGLQAYSPFIYRNIDGTSGANIVARKWREWSADACFIDNTGGFGSSWVDNLHRLGYSPIPVHFSAKSENPRYYNKRTEMIFNLVEWIKAGGALPPDDMNIVAELTESTYTFKNDKLLLEPKELLKMKIGRSPDSMDSLATTFAAPVQRSHSLYSEQTIHETEVDYEPFSREKAGGLSLGRASGNIMPQVDRYNPFGRGRWHG